MKFIVTQSNGGYDYEEDMPVKPCKNAVLENYTLVDIRTVSTLAEASKHHWYEQFMSRGSNHREGYLGKYVARDIGIRQHYVLEIGSLYELRDLFKETTYELIVSFEVDSDILERDSYSGEIEIYNGYRE